ncbi:DUF2799 domain-containing protein [Spartinivicinus ruber]|uniref:DUF2799 domain-containing protein n=1 Tax=Spartinivicinus ruber TaxID=2683272 RepID=UPI0013D42319|nr:DUF2799 domain-containing protein [Spartinivicinus ruber]
MNMNWCLIKLIKAAGIPTLLISLTACSVMSREECLTADWYTVGYADGADGRPPSRIGDYRQDCAEYGVRPDLDNYRLGHRSGLDRYCTEANGFQEGVEGNRYKGVCPYPLEANFLAGYNRGKQIYQAKREWKNIQDDLRRASSELEEFDEKINKKERELVKDGLTSARRAEILQDLNNIRYNKQQLQHKIYQLESDERWSKQQYNSLRFRDSW